MGQGEEKFMRERLRGLFFCFMTMALLGGCDLLTAKYVDISGEPAVREIVSTSRTTTEDLLILGIDSYPSKKEIKYYVLVPLPGFDGPEVLSRSVLPRGTKLYFTGARKCTNCSPQGVELSVNADGFSREKPVYIDMNWLGLLE